MNKELIHSLTENFESYSQQTESGVEFWLARDLQHLWGYAKWDNFQTVISKAKTACEVSGHNISDHFADVGKMVDLGSGSQREIAGTSAFISFKLALKSFFTDIIRNIRAVPLDCLEDAHHGRVFYCTYLAASSKSIIKKAQPLKDHAIGDRRRKFMI